MEIKLKLTDKIFTIGNLFREYEKEYKSEPSSISGLIESLQLIGGGEVTERSERHYMYKEMLKNDSLILVVHGRLTKSPYGGPEGYQYSFGIYRNNPRRVQIAGGYGASGIMILEHTRILSYCDYDIVHHNRNVISKVCGDIKRHSAENF